MRIFVGNLAWVTTEPELAQRFEVYGVVDHVNIPQERETGRPRGFGFVEMPHPTEAQAAIENLNGRRLRGRPLTVHAARARERDVRPRRERR